MSEPSGAATSSGLLWRPLFEAAAQTLVGAVASYAFGKLISRFFHRNTFAGAMDLWIRGIHGSAVGEGDAVRFDGLISPFTQLFPGDPLENAVRWNSLYAFPGRISSNQYQALEFVAGSDAALRLGSLNGETIVGVFDRYGFLGDGLVGIAPTSLLRKHFPEFFTTGFIGSRAILGGTLARCPGQHAVVAQAIAQRAGIPLRLEGYKTTWYLKINSVRPYRAGDEATVSLLGSLWAATDLRRSQYLVQYGYLTNPTEKRECLRKIQASKAWERVRVFCDDTSTPSQEVSFSRCFIR